jgi:protein-S-isoprenylcysteine O-methyltransferase Ste14
MPFMTWNLLALNLGLSAYMLIGTIFEEQKLVAQFGSAYEQYRRQTPRILPGIIGQKDSHPPEKSSLGDER